MALTIGKTLIAEGSEAHVPTGYRPRHGRRCAVEALDTLSVDV
jgi:hypothetical protein